MGKLNKQEKSGNFFVSLLSLENSLAKYINIETENIQKIFTYFTLTPAQIFNYQNNLLNIINKTYKIQMLVHTRSEILVKNFLQKRELKTVKK